jgi:hypothetical protein
LIRIGVVIIKTLANLHKKALRTKNNTHRLRKHWCGLEEIFRYGNFIVRCGKFLQWHITKKRGKFLSAFFYEQHQEARP